MELNVNLPQLISSRFERESLVEMLQASQSIFFRFNVLQRDLLILAAELPIQVEI